MIVLLSLVLVAAVFAVVAQPLRGGGGRRRVALSTAASGVTARDPQEQERMRDDLEAAREAKYREIRDAELDYRTGKLSHEDYQAIDADLRAEALDILNQYERAEGADTPFGAVNNPFEAPGEDDWA